MSEITDSMWIGNEKDARNVTFIQRERFDVVFSFEEFPINDHRQFLHGRKLHLSMLDSEKEIPNFQSKLEKAVSILITAVSRGEKVLLHCSAGKSRSVSVMIAYLMFSKQMTFTEAFDFVQKKRSCIKLNEAFFDFFQSCPIFFDLK